MAIREVVQAETQQTARKHRLVQVVITEGMDLYATWKIIQPNGREIERTTQVSTALKDRIMARAGVTALLTEIQNDTYNRVNV